MRMVAPRSADVIRAVREHRAQRFGARAIAVFGSAAGDPATPAGRKADG